MKKGISIEDRYLNVLSNIGGDKFPYSLRVCAAELAHRHRNGWRIPDSTYQRCRSLLHYKESLDRNSPYYIDLLKIEDFKSLEIVLTDLLYTIRIRRRDNISYYEL